MVAHPTCALPDVSTQKTVEELLDGLDAQDVFSLPEELTQPPSLPRDALIQHYAQNGVHR